MPLPTEKLIIWANTDVNLPELAGPNKTKPIDDLIYKGWDFKQKPAADEFNYLLNNLGQWINWAVTYLETGTSSNTPNTLVKQDSNGDFSAGNITASLLGNASTSSKWQTARNFALVGSVVGAVNLDGSGNVSLSTSITDSGISILTGTVAHGGIIPLPNGFTQSQCKWFVSPNIMYVKNDNTIDIGQCWADADRVVNCQMSATDSGSLTGMANYIIIGIK